MDVIVAVKDDETITTDVSTRVHGRRLPAPRGVCCVVEVVRGFNLGADMNGPVGVQSDVCPHPNRTGRGGCLLVVFKERCVVVQRERRHGNANLERKGGRR